jgi:hypothetical protein
MSKGSKRRPEKDGEYQDQWEKIFGKPKPEVKEHRKTPKHGVTKVHRDRTKYNRKDKNLDRTVNADIIDI